ncbi:MAG: hypothetical protein HYU81_00900 [Candidatus Brennerbacteria bacterium]|nr:hypothetical protein [Candidatus Brennerbacteria bacterium]
MNRSTIIAIVIALIAVAVGVYYFTADLDTTPEERALTEAADLLAGDESSNLSSVVDTSVNPVGETPDVNPVERANPFSGVKTNPFE